jgi:Family of unknown function (DUF6448)
MPPHCDSVDGPVVMAARASLATNDVGRVLPYVPVDGEAEVVDAFDRAMKVRALGMEAMEVADRWFFETVVRIHRAGEAAPFTGLKPAGLDVGPVIPAAERALESGQADELAEVLCGEIREQVERRHAHALELRAHAEESIPQARAYITAMLGLQVWAHGVHRQVMADPHAHAEGHAHG